MSTLTETINAMMTPELFRSLAVRAGVSETKVRTGMTAATGAIMEGLARHAHNPSVMDDTVQLIDRTPEVSDPLVAVEEDDRMRSASGQMLGLATNDTSGVTKRLATSLGVGTGVASSLLAAASSIILNGLHRFSRARGGMDSTALSATLLAEAPGFFAAMPGPVPSSWRERERRMERPAARSHERRWLWLLALIPIVAIGAWLINRHERGERRNATPMGKVTEPDRMAPQKRAITPPAPEPKSVVPEEPAPMSERQTMPDQTRAEPMTDQKQLQQVQWMLPLPSDQDQQVSGAESQTTGDAEQAQVSGAESQATGDAQQAQVSGAESQTTGDAEQAQVSGAESQATGDAQQAQESSENQQALGPEEQQEQQTNQDQSTESQEDQQRTQEQQATGPQEQQRAIPVPGMESQQAPQQQAPQQQAQGEQQPQQPPVEINPGTPPSEQPPVEINPGTPAGQQPQQTKPPAVAAPEQPSAGTEPQAQPAVPEEGAAAAIEAQIESANPPQEGVTLDEVKFDSGRASIKPGADEQLSRVAEILDANPDVRIQINGYTDLTGNKDANMKLSQKRADAAKDALMQRGIDGSRIEAKGRGGEEPMEETPVQSEANRRVTVLVVSR